MSLEKEVAAFFDEMRERALQALQKIDPAGKLDENVWSFPIGEMAVRAIRGNVFEKVGVSNANLRVTPPGQSEPVTVKVFEVCAHMMSPKVPVGTISLRYLLRDKDRFNCHTDLSPILPFQEDIDFYKGEMIALSERHGRNYEEMRQKLVNTFMSKYRKGPRGGGFGIAFDADEKTFAMVKDCGETFLRVFPHIVNKRKDEKYTEEEREELLRRRARWVEFNLVEDEGFVRGLELGISPEPMIVQTLPPLVRF